MRSVKLKIKLSKKSLAKLSSILLVFLFSFSLFLVKANSQSDESNDFGYVLLIFSVVVIVLTILVIIKNPISDFLLKNYKIMIIVLVIVSILIYFIPQIPIKSITGLFVAGPTTTTTTTPEVKEEVLSGLIQTFSEMQPGRTNSMMISEEEVSLTELDLDVYKNLKNVRIIVSRLSKKPTSTMQDPPGNVYQYLKVEKTNIKDEDLKKVTIKFRVDKSWINQNDIDESTISLYRYQDNIWFGLSTAKTDEDDQFSYYETYTMSLSFFAITGSSAQPQAVTTTTTMIVTTTTTTVGVPTTTTIAGVSTTLPLNINFDRNLNCHKCGQHKAPPLTDVNMTITATVSKPVQNTYLIDYYPIDWTVINPNGGQTSSFNSSYNKIQWSISSVDDSVTRWYVVKSPQRILPPTKYDFFSEVESQKSDSWQIIVADPAGETQPYDCNDANVECDETTVTVTYDDGSVMMINYQKPVNFWNATSNQWQAVNQTIGNEGCAGDYDYCVVKGNYEVQFIQISDYGNFINFTRNGSSVYYTLEELIYRNALESEYIISPVLTVTGSPNENVFTYPDVFGSGINITYEYLVGQLKQRMIINNFSDIGEPPDWLIQEDENVTLDLSFILEYGSLDLYINGELWDKKTTKETRNRVDFKDANGNTVFYLPEPWAYDTNETNISYEHSWYQFKKTGPSLVVIVKTPYLWFNASERVYPVTIDPTMNIGYNKVVDYYMINNTLNDYYFNATSTQRANDIQEYWTRNDVCLGLYFGNAWHEFCGDSLDWVWYNSTNFTTYVNLTGTTELKYAGYQVDARVAYYLEEDFPEVLGTVTLENVGNKDMSDSYIKIRTHDINVHVTTENDIFRVNTTSFWEPWSGYSEYWLNDSSLDLFYDQYDLTSRKYSLFDNSTESWTELEWNESFWNNTGKYDLDYNLSVKYGSESNAPVDLLLLTGPLKKNNMVKTNFRWADAMKQNFTYNENYYHNLSDTLNLFELDAYENGTQFYGQDLNMSLEMTSNNVIHVKFYDVIVNDTALEEIMFRFMGWKYSCFELHKVNSFDTFRCPENNTDLYSTIVSFAEQEIQLRERDMASTYAIPYLFLNNYTGTLDNFTETINSKNLTTIENEYFRKGRIKLSSLFDTENYVDEWEFDVYYPDVDGNSHCIDFPIPRWSNLTINVTMMNPISNYTFGRSEFIIDNHTEGNSTIAYINPYPSLGIKNVPLQTGQVCSG